MNVLQLKKKEIITTCAHCGTEMIINQSDDFKQVGNIHFCSLKCIEDHNVALIENYKKALKRYDFILSTLEHPSESVDALYLHNVWNGQSGKCGITNIPLVLPESKQDRDTLSVSGAELVMIDPNKGFKRGNVRFICSAISHVTNELSMIDTHEFINLIKTN